MRKKDKISRMGFRDDSPYRNSPFLDIHTPQGFIDMDSTGIPLFAMDETGYAKYLPPYSGIHQFMGSQVREIPLKKGGLTQIQYLTERGLSDGHNHGDFNNISPNQAREILHKKKVNNKPLTPEQFKLFGYLSKGNTLKYQQGGLKHFQQGGVSKQDLYKFLFEDDEEQDAPKDEKPENTAPSQKELELQQQNEAYQNQISQLQSQQEEDYALNLAMSGFNEGDEEGSIGNRGQNINPYASQNFGLHTNQGVNPNLLQTQHELFSSFPLKSMGIWGDKSHQQRKSDHNTGDAQDFGFANTSVAEEAIGKLQKEATQNNVKYIIYNGKIWNPSISQEWRPYNGPNPHKDHFHVSYNRKYGGNTYQKGGKYRPKN